MNSISLQEYPLCDTSGNVQKIIQVPVAQFEEESYLVPTWQNYQEICFYLADLIAEASIEPQTIITAANGGLLPAKFVQDRLSLQVKVHTVGLSGYGSDNQPLNELEVTHWLPEKTELSGATLIIDDINDSGRSIEKMVAELSKSNPKKIYTAVALMRKKSPVTVDFAGCMIGNEWVLFPSDLTENESNLRAIWTKNGISQEIQDLRAKILNSQNFEDQLKLMKQLEKYSFK